MWSNFIPISRPASLNKILGDREAHAKEVVGIKRIKGYFKDYLDRDDYPSMMEGEKDCQYKIFLGHD